MKLWNSMVFPRKLSTNCWVSTSMLIRRPLPSLSLGGAAPGITEGVRHGPVPALCFAMMVPPEAPLAVSIGLRNCYVARFQLPPQAPQAVSIELRNCYVARFEHALEASKASKAPQQLSKAFEPQNIPQQLAKASRLLCHGTSRGPTSGFYWASKLLRGTFSATSPGPTSCFSWASKLLRGTFWAPLKSLKSFKSPAAAFEGLWTANPPQQLAKASRLLCHGTSRGPTSCFYWASKRFQLPPQAPQAVSLGLRNCYVAHFEHPLKASKASKSPQQLSKAFEPQNPPQVCGMALCLLCALPSYLPRPHKRVLLGFEAATWHVFSYLPRPHKLFLLGFETATWHILGTP